MERKAQKQEEETKSLISRSSVEARKTKGKFRSCCLIKHIDGKNTISASSIRRLEKDLKDRKEEVSWYSLFNASAVW